MEIKGKGKPIFCGSGGEWKVELEQRLQKDDEIVTAYTFKFFQKR